MVTGTTHGFGIEIGGLDAYDSQNDNSFIFDIDAGYEHADPITNIKAKAGISGGYQYTKSKIMNSEKSAKSNYEYSFTFSYDLSTSTDPAIAGHASDLIMGGGLNIVLIEAIRGIYFT